MITRREYLKLSLAAGAALTIGPAALFAETRLRGSLITRAIPSSGQKVPVVGLGSSATFAQVARSEDVSALPEVFAAMLEHGGAVFDTAPSYGASEEVSGRIAKELGLTEGASAYKRPLCEQRNPSGRVETGRMTAVWIDRGRHPG